MDDGKLGTRIALDHPVQREQLTNKVNNSVKTVKNMKKYTAITAAIAASALSFAAQATTVLTGSIGFAGSANIGAQTWGPGLTYVTVTSASINQTGNTASFSPLSGDTAIFNNPVSLVVANYSSLDNGWGKLMFTVIDGSGDTWQFFDVATTASAFSSQLNQFGASGTGDVIEWSPSAQPLGTSAVGYWNVDVSNEGASYTFGGTQYSPVPDGGLTVALLGGSLIALQAFRRKLFC
jgi:hypothetical protein